ncbi:hypothetical protein QBC39DRAFT_88161 [Podospora conica]|nr:hypothetical protein QBC39DRAFT_88161 [Schizothecium conicum]
MGPTIQVPSRTPGKPKPKKPNAVRKIMERHESRERRVRESSAAMVSSAAAPGLATASRRLQCPTKDCKNPDVRSGTCHGCGAVVQENNIVADITFGEASNGAAVVQGNYLAADQGAIRSQGGGYAFRRVAGSGSEARERAIREVKTYLQQWTHQLQISQALVESALRHYKIAANNNFVQGRRMNNVAAICLYSVCRKENNNRVMLIDLADIIKTDVFLLGRDYKALLSRFPELREGTRPIIMEDLIFRFASKLEFYHDTRKVAEAAARIAARMQKDNMTHGRRPAGICGAAVIMAARAHNYRRTVREVVYIAKVTMATLQERMEEFANVPSAQMTISEFINQDFLESSHDPPASYKQTKEWKEKHQSTRKRKARDISQGDHSAEGAEASQSADATNEATASQPPTSAPASTPVSTIDKDGFVVPPLPQRAPLPTPAPTQENPEVTHERSVIATATTGPEAQLEYLASEYGDSEPEDLEDDPSSELAMAAAQGVVVPGKKPKPSAKKTSASDKAAGKRKLVIDAAWEAEEASLEQEVEEALLDPNMISVSEDVTRGLEERLAQQQAAETAAVAAAAASASVPEDMHMEDAEEAEPEPDPYDKVPIGPGPGRTPKSAISDDPIVHEDEFADDPEVMYCKLGEQEAKIKEMIWANHNKDFMRQSQQKIFESKMSESGPPKQRRNRAKKPRIGEGQASPAGSAEEAAVNMMRTRGISTKLDYSRLGQVFDLSKRGPGSTYGGASSAGSRSNMPSADASEAGSDDEDGGAPATNGGGATSAPAQPKSLNLSALGASVGDEDEAMGEDDYEGASYEDHNDYQEYGDVDPFADDGYGDE